MIELPVGVLTFLFTDIEGSTKRWEHEPEAMQAALARHDTILRSAIEAQGGIVYKTVGDAFCAVFRSPEAALTAAIDAQRDIQAETWDARLGSIRVRMGIHTGQAERRGTDYFGPPVNRVSRVMSAGHGGQILVTTATVNLLGERLPEGCTLRDLGERQLKDLLKPEHIFQVNVPGLADQFPPLNTLDQRPNNLPVAPTPLLGRDRDEAAVRDLLLQTDVRLVTLLGPGGMGKTRLSLQLAADLSDDFADGLYFIALAAVTEGEFVVSAIAQTLGVREVPGRTLRETLSEYVREKKMLLVLDNLEQVVAPAAPVVAELLQSGPRLKMLSTSRIPLHVPGEREYPVPPLALPNPRHLPPLGELAEFPAIQLFTQRAVAAKHDFALTRTNAPAVAQICAMLDGLPLAIELAAARVKILPPPALLQRLTPPKSDSGLAGRLRMLAGGARDLPERHQTLTNTIAFSYDLLVEGERALFRRLAVFVDGWTLEEAQAVAPAAGSLPVDIPNGLASLADKSLIRQSEAEASTQVRYSMLQVIREFGFQCLDEAHESAPIRQAHAGYFKQFSGTAEQHLSGAEQATWLNTLETEHDNLRAALAWAREQCEAEFGLNLAGTLCRFWQMRGYLTEARTWAEDFLALDNGSAAPAVRALVLHRLGGILLNQGDYLGADAVMEDSLRIYRDIGDERGVMRVLNGLGQSASFRGNYAQAEALWTECLDIARRVQDTATATMLMNLGIVAHLQHDNKRAQMYLAESRQLAEEHGDVRIVALVLGNLGQVAMSDGDQGRAAELYTESLKSAWELGLQTEAALILEYLGEARTALGEDETAARLFGMAEALREDIGARRPGDDQPDYDAATATLRARMGDEAFATAFAAGRAADREREVPALVGVSA